MAGEFRLQGFAQPVSAEGGYQAAGNAAREAEIQKGAWARALRQSTEGYVKHAQNRDLMQLQADRADKRDALTRDYDRMARDTAFERSKDLRRLDWDMKSQLQGEELEERRKLEQWKRSQELREKAEYTEASGIVSGIFDEARANKTKDPFQRVDRPLADLHPQFMGKTDQELARWFLQRNPGQDEEWAKKQVQVIKRPGGTMYLAPGLLDPVVQRAMDAAAQRGVSGESVQKALKDYLAPYGKLPNGYKDAQTSMIERYDKELGAHFRPETHREAAEGNAIGALMEQIQSTQQNVPGEYQQTGTQATPKQEYDPDGQMMLGPQGANSPGIVDAPDDLTNPKTKPGALIAGAYGNKYVDSIKLQSGVLSDIGLSTEALMPNASSAAASNYLKRLNERDVRVVPVRDPDGMVTGVKLEGDLSDIPAGHLSDFERAINTPSALSTFVGRMMDPAGTKAEQQDAARLYIRHTPSTPHSSAAQPVPENVDFIGNAFKKFQ
jgi:hypothetical protein